MAWLPAGAAWSGAVPDAANERTRALHPPVGVVAGHTLDRGGIALGYALDVEHFDELRERTNDVTAAGYISRTPFPSAPDRFRVERHDFFLLVGTTDRISLRFDVPFVKKEMINRTASCSFTTESGGLGDIALTSIFLFMKHDAQRLFFTAQLGMPTGSISERDDTPAGEQRLPYAMQLGTGVWHVETGLVYEGHEWKYTWGGQITTLFRFGENGAEHTPGHRNGVSGWLAREWCEEFSTSLRLQWVRRNNTSERDPRIDIAFSPANDPMRQRGERVDLLGGFELGLPFAPRHRLAVEAGFPLLERLDGPQPSLRWKLRAGWRWVFP